jgi:hypothetical protein
MRKIFLILATSLLITACSHPIPPDHADYVGRWEAPNMLLLIQQDGRASYKRQDGNTTNSIDAPLQRFEGKNFVLGVGPLETTFVVSQAPHQENGQWRMTVDGVELHRVQ